MDPQVKYLLSLEAVRDRAKIVGEAAKLGKLSHFDVHEDRLPAVADYVTGVIKRDYGPDRFSEIPPHGRWQHFEVGNRPRIDDLLSQWKAEGHDDKELTRRLIDLFFVSVLLDAGAGDHWRYVEPGTEQTYERSEGIAVASLYMFKEGAFASSQSNKMIVDGKGLERLTPSTLASGFQITAHNPMLGVDSRASLLKSLGSSLLAHADVFGASGRPGNIVDHMLETATDASALSILDFWDVLQDLLIPIWPRDRTVVNGYPIGDAWPLSTLRSASSSASLPNTSDADFIQPFHKLTQWLTYSLTVPFTRLLNVTWKHMESMTALPEYRNGGLFVDLGVLSVKPASLERGLAASGSALPQFGAGDDAVVEWRAMTLVLIDKLYEMVKGRMEGVDLSMAQLLEAGTWKSGREVAKEKRPDTKSSPILIESDGTVF
ncbi:uncharacterized protein N0V89_005087 [Didymosphaeria variabile]|uniref:DUF1688-domain-containing protein n=1 Tax=Didymosphaeria variabile TaxID=1932322 RepID=A0A9W8XKV1_9PLEO|nr:uncharacterized protein N0V89_005087 [Didymosphaeria variabile]KAJ4353359.1 hypothetical protein N0V89_005087 [Didymosphaeria variabile]